MSEILNKIKSNGYWRLNIRPIKYSKENLLSLTELRNTVESSIVRLRGWDYPHIDYQNYFNGSNFVETNVDFGGHKELFRCYQSKQIIHYFSVREDYEVDIKKLRPLSVKNLSPTDRYLEILITLYRITEIFEFISRLTLKKFYDHSIQFNLDLNNSFDRQLFFLDIGRDLWDSYRCKSESLEYEEVISVDDILSNGHKKAVDIVVWIFERFNWHRVPKDLLFEEQRKLLEKR